MKWIYPKSSTVSSLYCLAIAVSAVSSTLAQNATSAKVLVTAPVVEAQTVTFSGNEWTEANAQNDQGSATDALKLDLMLQLKVPQDRQTALNERIQAMPEATDPACWWYGTTCITS